MESYNRLLRKVTKSIFPSDDSLYKWLYLSTMDLSKIYSKNYGVEPNYASSQYML